MAGLGYIPDVPDDGRDWVFGAGTAERPPQLELWADRIPILNQGRINSCVANSVFQALRLLLSLQGKTEPLGARLWAYWLARAEDGEIRRDRGASFRATFRSLAKFGYPWEKDYSHGYDLTAWAKRPRANDFRLAFDKRSKAGSLLAYHRLKGQDTQRLEAIQSALVLKRPVLFGTSVDASFIANVRTTSVIGPPSNDLVGGHAMIITGYSEEDQAFSVVNSHGRDFGVDGTCRLSYEYVLGKHSRDFWTISLRNTP